MLDFSKQMQMALYYLEDGTVSANAYIKDEDIWRSFRYGQPRL